MKIESLLKATTSNEHKLLCRAPAICERAIGKQFSVRSYKLPRNVSVTGIIVAAEPASFHYTRCSVSLLFRVTIEAGANKTRHVFVVKSLPQ